MSGNQEGTFTGVGEVYCAHHGWLYALLRRRLGDAADAADLAQDAFVRLLARPRRFDSAEGTRAYLSTVARGLCVDLWRRREVERAWLETLAVHPEITEPSAEHRVQILQTLYEVDRVLADLPPKVGRAFMMGMVFEETDARIAAELGVSDRMVRKYMARAMLHCMHLAWQD